MRAHALLAAVAVLVVALATTGPAEAQKLYRWTDKQGNVHLTDTPPPPDAVSQEQHGSDRPRGPDPKSAWSPAMRNAAVTGCRAAIIDRAIENVAERSGRPKEAVARDFQSRPEMLAQITGSVDTLCGCVLDKVAARKSITDMSMNTLSAEARQIVESGECPLPGPAGAASPRR